MRPFNDFLKAAAFGAFLLWLGYNYFAWRAHHEAKPFWPRISPYSQSPNSDPDRALVHPSTTDCLRCHNPEKHPLIHPGSSSI